MEPEAWRKIKSMFDSAILLRKEDRTAYLENACGGDPELRREVEGLLETFHAAERFLEKPFAGEIADALVGRGKDELEPGQVFNRYKIIRKIGDGGMGKVYLAQDTQLKRHVAIKLLSDEATRNPHQVSRFVQEARYASLLNHPNILTIFEIGEDAGMHFISTEYIPGETLRSRMTGEPFDPKQALDIAIDVASALVVAHDAGILHRDIKPENIMLREDGLLKVLDFGLAKLNRNERLAADRNNDTWGDVRTDPGLILGTVTYMSPEQASGSELDARTDIWSLGVILYELLAGRTPFSGSSPAAMMLAIMNEEPRRIKLASPNLARKVRHLITRALAKVPDERYQEMREMLDDLKCLKTEIESGAAESRSIAILPFINIAGDASLSFFEFALADAVITELGHSRSLLVRPSSSVAKYMGKASDPLAIAQELKVDAILAANFLLYKNRIRVTTQLIDVDDKNVLWSEQIDSEAGDIIGLQDMITHRIVQGLKCELEPPANPRVALPVTHNSTAYMEYLRGRDQLRRYMFHTVANKNVEIAISHFRRAIDLDPTFALAHCALGTSYIQRVIKVEGNQADLEAAAAALDHALVLDPQIVDARAYRTVIARLQGQTQRSRDEMSELRRDAPNNFEVQYLSAACYRFDGEYEKALQCFDQMLRIDPTAQVAVHYCRARLSWYSGEFQAAFRELEQAAKLEPNHPVVKFFHAIVTFRSGDAATAADELRHLCSDSPSNGFRPYLSMCLSTLGDREGALRELSEETERIAEVDPDVSYWLASANLMVGRIDTAFEWLERSIGLGNHNLRWFEKDPFLEPMRRDPRYADLVSDIRETRVRSAF